MRDTEAPSTVAHISFRRMLVGEGLGPPEKESLPLENSPDSSLPEGASFALKHQHEKVL